MKKLALGLGTTLAVLGLLEGASWGLEAALGPIDAATPLPSPAGASCRQDCVEGAASWHVDYPSGIPMGFGGEAEPWQVFDRKYGLNSLGLRGPEPSDPRPADELRLLTLGDSTVFGFEVAPADIFSSVAAVQLTEDWGRPVVAFVGAQPGHTAQQSQRVLERVGGDLDADIVVIASQWSDMFHDRSGGWIETPGQKAPSALYRVIHRAMSPWLEPRIVGWIDPSTGAGTPAEGLQARTPPDDYARLLTAMRDDVSASGATPVFVVLPAPIDLDPAGPPEFITAYRELMRTVARDGGAPLIDCSVWFVEQGGVPADFYDSVHPSRSGHERLGACVAAGLVEQLPGVSGG
ncbi:MAG: hypothetical protein GY913_17805 [Proteobacteria bacterium]|nr:hypothetical protein [Pseudomonadota bacterium]MCP4918762.1 hypothetical protein [Pseudomonadota bacterium]